MKFHLPFGLSCEEFRLRTGAEPQVVTWSQRLHGWICGKCRLFAKDVRCIDRDLMHAFCVDLDAPRGAPRAADQNTANMGSNEPTR